MAERIETIKEFMARNFERSKRERLAKLESLNAPGVIIENLKRELDAGDYGVDKVGHVQEFGDIEFVSFVTKKYRHGTGVHFTTTDGSVVKMIPGPYGLFLTDKEK